MLYVYQETTSGLVLHVELGILSLYGFGRCALFGVKMVLPRLTPQKLTLFSDFKTLRIRLIGFHCHIFIAIVALHITYFSLDV